jgi:exonuclease VII small subunit
MYSHTLDSIDVSLLDGIDVASISKYYKIVKDLEEKIRDYLENTIKGEVYEKALYAYIMLRTELLTAIQILRKLLKLNEEEDKK